MRFAASKLQVEKLITCSNSPIAVPIWAQTKGFDKDKNQLIDFEFNVTKYEIGDNTRVTLFKYATYLVKFICLL